MADFDNILRSSKFLRQYTKFQHGKQKGLIYVEDALDRIFWTHVINSVCPNRYIIKPYTSNGATGKRKLEKEFVNLHKDLMVAIDGDFDYVCPNRNEYSAHLLNNPYVIHTFYYSRESLVNTPEAVRYILESFHLYEHSNNKLLSALNLYSNIIYKALLIFSWLHNKDCQTFKDDVFNQAVRLPIGTRILNDDLTTNKNALKGVMQSIENYILMHSPHIIDIKGYEIHCAELKNKGITRRNAYLFTNGHYLLDGILLPALKMVIKRSLDNDKKWVENNFPEKCVSQRKAHVINHYKENCNATTLIHQCNAYCINPFWKKIAEKLHNAVSIA